LPAPGGNDRRETGFEWKDFVNPRDFVFFDFSVLIAGSIGYLIGDQLFPRSYPWWLVCAFAPVSGFGICSLIVFLFRRPMSTVEALLFIVLLFLWFRSFRSQGAPLAGWRKIFSVRVSVFAVLFAVVLGWGIQSSLAQADRMPHGGSDGWAIWGSHAKYMATGGKTWTTDIQNTFNPDYPLLLPGALVHVWRYIGNNSPEAAGYLGIVFELTAIGILAATLIKLQSPAIGWIMAFVLIGSPAYVLHSTSGYADIPLSAYVVGTIALICLYEFDDTKPPGLIALAGFMAGSAAWTKNEGVPFVLAALLIFCLPVFRTRTHGAALRRLAGFAAGLALPLAAIVYFKLTIAPPNYLFDHRNSADLLAKISDSSRYLIIFRSYIRTGWTFGGWVFNPFVLILAFIGLCGIDKSVLRNFGWRAGVSIIAVLLAAYFAIYIITPLELNDHLAGSLNRLLMQIWPGCLLLAGMTARKQVTAN
jgi:hypothetical protein